MSRSDGIGIPASALTHHHRRGDCEERVERIREHGKREKERLEERNPGSSCESSEDCVDEGKSGLWSALSGTREKTSRARRMLGMTNHVECCAAIGYCSKLSLPPLSHTSIHLTVISGNNLHVLGMTIHCPRRLYCHYRVCQGMPSRRSLHVATN